MTSSPLEALLARQQAARWRVAATSADQRRAKLRALLEALMAHRAEAQAALAADFRKSPEEVDLTELYPVISEIKDALRHLPRWMRARKVPTPIGLFGSTSTIVQEPKGVVLIISPWNYPIYLTLGPLVSALAAGNCIVLKPAEQTPMSIMVLMDLIKDILPPGILNIVNGFGIEAGKPLASSPRIAKIAFTGETTTGRLILQSASENLIPSTVELGGKSPNIFFADVMREDDDFFDKALEGFTMFALNQGEVCTCPSRALVHESIYDRFMERAIKRVEAIKLGSPLDFDTMIGAQASNDQLEKILSYVDIGKAEGAKVLTGGGRHMQSGDLAEGYYMTPTLLEGHNKMRVFQEEIFGPVLAVTTFKDDADALAIANDTLYGLGAGVWSRDANTCYRFGREIQAGRVWTNCYHAYPAHAAFGGYKQSGIGRETHKMMLDHYQQTKNMLVSYSPKKLGFF